MLEHGGMQFQWSSKKKSERNSGLYATRLLCNFSFSTRKRAIVTDICVPQTELGRAVLETQKDISRSGISGPILGHVGDGNFHAILLVDPENPKEMKAQNLLLTKWQI